jgi:hypothetical protein
MRVLSCFALILILTACSDGVSERAWVVPPDEATRLVTEFATFGLPSESVTIVCGPPTGSADEERVSGVRLFADLLEGTQTMALTVFSERGDQVSDFEGWQRFNLPGSNADEGLGRWLQVGLKGNRVRLLAGGICSRS